MITDICATCVHNEVCKYKAINQAAQKAVDGIQVEISMHSWMPLKEIPYIKAEIGCEYFKHV